MSSSRRTTQITVEEAIRDRSRGGTTLRVLDTFSGTGNALVYARDSLPGGRDAPSLEMFATDYVFGMLRRASTKVSAAFSQSDCHALPFADDSFDIVMAIGGIQAADDVRKAIAELNRVAKPGGLVLINHWQLHRGATPFEQVWYRLIASRLYSVYEAPVNELPPLIKSLRVSQLGPFFFTMSFEKVGG